MWMTRKQAHIIYDVFMLTCILSYISYIFYISYILDIVDRSEMSKTRKRAHMLKKKVLQAGTSLGTKPDKERGG